MHVRIFNLSAWMLTVAVAWGVSVPVHGEEGSTPSLFPDTYNSTASRNHFVSGDNEAALAARLAEVEKALKKLDDKAKAANDVVLESGESKEISPDAANIAAMIEELIQEYIVG